MTQLYQRPPILEALCELRFEETQPWDWTIPGLVYAELKSDFPKKRELHQHELGWQVGEEELSSSLKSQIARMQFLDETERVLVQVGRDLLAVNHLRPYPGWDCFKNTVVQALGAYMAVAKPKGLRHVGLRYVNRIELSESAVETSDYVKAFPGIPEALPQVYRSWLQRVEIPYQEDNGLLLLQTGTLQRPDGKISKGLVFMLDLDFVALQPNQIPLDDALIWVESAHGIVETAFEACVTDLSRHIFQEVKHDTVIEPNR